MSWSLSFTAKTKEEAIKIVEYEKLPVSMERYIIVGLQDLPDDVPVKVEGHGHLHTGKDFQTTSATLLVEPIFFRKPPE